MKKCPKCQEWLMVYDPYFERYRCPNSECQYMPPSAVERAIKRMENPEGYQFLIKEGTVEAYYDTVTDALIVNWGEIEPTIELPEPDGRLIWKVARDSHKVIGFEFLGIVEWDIDCVDVDIYYSRIENLECIISDLFRNQRLDLFSTSTIVERVSVITHQSIARRGMGQAHNVTLNFSSILERVKKKINEVKGKELQKI